MKEGNHQLPPLKKFGRFRQDKRIEIFLPGNTAKLQGK
jgi:hypothetical protein